MRLTLALSYGGQDEIIRAMQKIAQKVQAGKMQPEDINSAVLESHLDTHDMPPPDLIIRTSGEQRLSNFLPWQSAYSELFFTDVLWPAFTNARIWIGPLKFTPKETDVLVRFPPSTLTYTGHLDE